jgi:hypothetical protein
MSTRLMLTATSLSALAAVILRREVSFVIMDGFRGAPDALSLAHELQDAAELLRILATK